MKMTPPPLKKIYFLFATLFLSVLLSAQTESKQYFVNAKIEIDSMLSGKKPLDYERAVFITENAYHNNGFEYAAFQKHLDNYQILISYLKNTIDKRFTLQPNQNVLVSKDSANKNCNSLKENYAIYKFMTDTIGFIRDSIHYFHIPFEYSYNDPFATNSWEHSQVLNLLYSSERQGNCLALTSLFKILSLRFHSNITITTTQGHIFITHTNENGRLYNIELASKSFPGTGSIEILTHTSDKAARSGIAMRELNLKQSIGLCLVNLAKSYERKFATKTDPFILSCAELNLKYDSLNLNAMLLKAETMEINLLSRSKSFNQLKSTKEFLTYQNYIKHLHNLGYREMPIDMKNKLISALTKDTAYVSLFKDNTHNPFPEINKKNNRTFSMTNGMFEEFDIEKPTQKYFRTVFDTRAKKIIAFKPIDILYNNYEFDPVVFSWQIDPLAHKFPHQSPYCAFDDNPINKIDPTGCEAEDWFKNLKTGEVKEDKLASGKKGEEVSLKGSMDAWQNLGKTESEPEVVKAKADFNMTHHSATYPWATGRADQDYTFDGGAVGGIIVKNVLKPIVSPIFSYLGSKVGGEKAVNYLKLLQPKDEFDAATILYRGTTGSEGKSTVIFLTNNAEVAASYVLNGGRVMSYNVSDFALFSLQQGGKLAKFTGKNLTTGVTNTEYKFMGKEIVEALNTIAK